MPSYTQWEMGTPSPPYIIDAYYVPTTTPVIYSLPSPMAHIHACYVNDHDDPRLRVRPHKQPTMISVLPPTTTQADACHVNDCPVCECIARARLRKRLTTTSLPFSPPLQPTHTCHDHNLPFTMPSGPPHLSSLPSTTSPIR